MENHLDKRVEISISTVFILFTTILLLGLVLPASTSWGCTRDQEYNLISYFPYQVFKNGKWGLIDKTGQYIVKPRFDDIEDFHEGLAVVKLKKKMGFIDKNGKIVIKPRFNEASYFREGLAAVKVNGKWGFVNKTGSVLTPYILLEQMKL